MADGLLSGDITIPHVGKLPKWAVAGGVGITVFLVIRHYRNQSSSAAAGGAGSAGAAAGDPYPADGTYGDPSDPYSLDPSTGVTYGDEAASGAGAGYGGYDVGVSGAGGGYGISAVTDAYPWDGTYSNTSDPYSMDPSTGQTYGNEGTTGTSSGVTTGASGPPFSTNAQWSQYVLNYFTQESFSDIAGMTDAIGLYLAGQSVTALQQGYINDATAIAGSPPVAGSGNYPPSIRTTGSTASPTGPTSGTTTTKTTTPTVSGGHVVSVKPTQAVIAWTGAGATSWQVKITGPGPINGHTSVVGIAQATYTGLQSGHTYDVAVQPLVNGKAAGKSGTITFVTPK